ncbi:unnamed protein product [Alopecurus aequalis]
MRAVTPPWPPHPARQERVHEPEQIWPNPSPTRAHIAATSVGACERTASSPGGVSHRSMASTRPVRWSQSHRGSRYMSTRAAAIENTLKNFTEVARSARRLRIEGFSLMPETNPMSSDGHFVKTTWSIYGYDWEVRFYPSMAVAKPTASMPDKWVAVELVFPNTSSEGETRVGAKLWCWLVDPSGKLNPAGGDVGSGVSGPSPESTVSFLLPRLHLAESGFLKHDSVTIECCIVVLMRSRDMTVLPGKQAPAPPSNLNLDLAQLQQSKTGADVTFLVSGESFDAHKLILAARSPVFSAEFFGDIGEKSTQQIQVEGISAPTFKAMLNFIYADAVSEFDQRSEATTELAQDLLAAADRYGLDRLKMICEVKIYDGINAGTAATTLAFAEQHNCSQLKAKCIDFIVSTPDILDEVLATDGYTHLVASHPSVLRDLLMSARGTKRLKQGI